jgi:hypothetical protein
MYIPISDEERELFSSTSGMSTREWGPHGWSFLFTSIMGAFPVKVDKHNKEHKDIANYFRCMLLGLAYTMPCIYCRQSFKQFAEELPIEGYLVGRVEMMYWLYCIRDKVNQKLIQQEKEAYNNKKKELKTRFKRADITRKEYYNNLEDCKQKLITTPSPPFIDVLKKYEAIRAACSPKAKTCAK